MRVLQRVLFLMAMSILVPQTVRHFYVKYIAERTSVLDRYQKQATEKEIEGAQSLEGLLAMYDPARKCSDDLDKQCKGESEEEQSRFRDVHSEEYDKERKIRGAIGDWEEKSKEIRQLKVYWSFGAGLLLLGIVFCRCAARWLGMALLIPGFSEMIWWTSPSFGWTGPAVEFDWLLTNKILFTCATLAILLTVWLAAAWADRRVEVSHGK
jgi:hypothetical protein